MKRRNYFIEDETISKLEEMKKEHGFNTVSAFIRYILTAFIKKNNIRL